MPFIEFEGRIYYIPGVYTKTKVASTLPGPLPAFHVPILLGQGVDGHPYDADSKRVTGEPEFSPFLRCNTEAAAASYFGSSTEIHRAMRFAKRHGLPFAFVANLSPMTRASIIADTVTTNIEQFTLHARKFGPAANWIKIGYASNTLTIVPVKRFAMLSANLPTTSTRAYVVGGGIESWLTKGATVMLGANDVTGVSRTIVDTGIEIDSAGQRQHWVELSSAPASACNTAQYAMLVQYATEQTVEVASLSTSQLLIDYFNNSDDYFRAVKHANFTNAAPATIATPKPLKEITEWGTVVKGTAPAPTSSDVTAFIALMNGSAWEQFVDGRGLIPQTYLLAMGDSASHILMRDYAEAERVRGYPISVTVGCRWGDIVVGAGDDTDPTKRASDLNSDSVMLCAGGLDREAAYLSFAPAVWGRRVEGGVAHNLTNDRILFSELETRWNEIEDSELSELARKGVVTQKLSIGQTIARKVSQGSTTLQASAVIWNTADATTWSAMQRDLADFIDVTIRRDFEEGFVGADAVDANAIAAALTRRAEKSLVKRGYLKAENGFRITGIALNSAGNGFDVEWAVRLPDTVDYITVTTTILVGEA